MKITAIKPQTKRTDRLSIFVDGVYSFSLSQSELLRQSLHPNQEINNARLHELKKLSQTDKTYLDALRYVSMRQRSEWEIKSYLGRKKTDPKTIDEILNKLSIIGLVNDSTFANSWIDNRQLLKPRSTRQLKQELRKKNIDKEVIDSALAGKQIDETANIVRIIENKRKQPRYRDDQKLIAYLARQGFYYEDIKSAMKNLNGDRNTG
jgi:regulatory protein